MVKVIRIGLAGEHLHYRDGNHEEVDGLVLNDLLTDLFEAIPCLGKDGRKINHINPGGWHENCEHYWSLDDIDHFLHDLPYALSFETYIRTDQTTLVKPALRLDVCIRQAYWTDNGHSLNQDERVQLERYFCEKARNGADFELFDRKDGVLTAETLPIASCKEADLSNIESWDDICLLYIAPLPIKGFIDERMFEVKNTDEIDRRRIKQSRQTLLLAEALEHARLRRRANSEADLVRKLAKTECLFVKLKGTYDTELLASSGDPEGWRGRLLFDGFVRLSTQQTDDLLTMNSSSFSPFACTSDGISLRTDETFGFDRVLVCRESFVKWLDRESASEATKSGKIKKLPANERHANAIRKELARLGISEPIRSQLGTGRRGLRSELSKTECLMAMNLTKSQFDDGWKLISKT